MSNCSARNNRLQFAHELSKYIQVDIYGACGTYKCSRTTADKCFDILDRDYKFYLAFENSNCRDYITEKFFVNGLSRTTLPIVVSECTTRLIIQNPDSSLMCLDGRTSWGLWDELTSTELHSCRWVRVGERVSRLPSHPWRKRRALQLVLQVEGDRRVHQHVLLVSRLFNASRRGLDKSTQMVWRRQRLVARPRSLHKRLVEEVPGSQRCHDGWLVYCYFSLVCYEDNFLISRDATSRTELIPKQKKKKTADNSSQKKTRKERRRGFDIYIQA